ncbi:sugar kinase [Labrys miyagiensis]|uniref:Sugar kinase n=1 Tax=Labrys miyagiensis TaxID=346912 RepID=A0ABQ6CQT8_9HYPH|nr:ROK family transcriptional regulator [Labrys miyagiensis]GLS22524.1 sugar kinase [Labrys miyagiensis]
MAAAKGRTSVTKEGKEHEEAGSASGAGTILWLIATGRACSRSALTEASGLSRSTVTERLAALFDAGLIEEAPEALPSGGRPARMIRLNTDFGVVLSADIGESHARLAITDLEPRILAEAVGTIDIRHGPVPVLGWIVEQFRLLLKRLGRRHEDVLGIGIGLPAPVDHEGGRVVGPSVMTGWDDFDIRAWLQRQFDAPVSVENDVNLMTLAEFRRFWPEVGQFLFIKAGTGIGSGIITDGRLYRGAQGAAGDIGHIQFTGEPAPLCRCGKLGCVEARAAGWAIARDLSNRGVEATTARDVIDHLRANQPEAVRLVREAGRVLGEVTADVVSVLNPSVIVIGGTLAQAGEDLLSGVRELVYQRSLPLATRNLTIAAGQSDIRTGLLLGAALLVIETQMRPETIERTIIRHQRSAAAGARRRRAG